MHALLPTDNRSRRSSGDARGTTRMYADLPANGSRESPALEQEPAGESLHPEDDRITVIYIAGYGRSGSTLLDIALGEHPDILGAGELSTLARHVWANREYCACGKPVPDCALWQGAVGDWLDGQPDTMLADYHRAQRIGETILGLGRRWLRWRRPEHAARTAQLFRAIARHSGKRVIVDSSKLPGRGFALADLPGIDLIVVHLVRDPRGVAWSLRQQVERELERGVQRNLHPKWILRTTLRWTLVNLAVERLCSYAGHLRAFRVRYEDFVTHSQKTVDRILTMAKVSPNALPNCGRGILIAPRHQMAGSRHRMSVKIAFHLDEGWKRAMPVASQRWVARFCAPLMRRYGYDPSRP